MILNSKLKSQEEDEEERKKSFVLLPLLALGSSFLQQKHEIFILLWALQIFGPPCRMPSGSLSFFLYHGSPKSVYDSRKRLTERPPCVNPHSARLHHTG